MQLAEVAIRNTVQRSLATHYGVNWYQRGSFTCTLPTWARGQLDAAIKEARAKYGAAMTADHIVAELYLGFWVHLTTKNYEGALWPKCFATSFPHMPGGTDREKLYARLERMRLFRNRIAHHKPIFDHGPKAEYQNFLELTRWVCEETKWFMTMIARIDQVINAKPQPIP